MRAIETVYKGCRFRSRLEARWAVFFDAMGMDWQYEPEGYDLGEAGWYLPDFFIRFHPIWKQFCEWPDPGRFIEIKPIPPTMSECKKLAALTEFTRHHSYVFAGMPGEQRIFFASGKEQTGNGGAVLELWIAIHQLHDAEKSAIGAINAARQARFDHRRIDRAAWVNKNTQLSAPDIISRAKSNMIKPKWSGIWKKTS